MRIRQYVIVLWISVSVLMFFMAGCSTTKSAGTNLPDQQAETVETNVSAEDVEIKEFILGAGDTIEIDVYRHDDLKRSIQINSSGVITYPMVGDVKAAGLGLLQLRDKISDGLSRYIKNPQVSVAVTSVQSSKYSVIGEVKNPGIFGLDRPVNLLEAMATAGGFTHDAKQESILLIRGGLEEPQLITLNVKDILNQGKQPAATGIQNGDIVYVPSTIIADVSRFFSHLSNIINPIVAVETGYFLGQRIEAGSGSASVSAR